MKTVPGTSSQKISIENNKPEVSVKIDKEKMMALGLRLGPGRKCDESCFQRQ